MSLAQLLARQMAWAGDRPRRDHVLNRLEDNLFMPLHPATWADFACGSGDELGLRGQTPKMSSLRSSSAFACNVFDPWRGSRLGAITHALGFADDYSELVFEQKLPHGLTTTPPNLDVMFFGRDVSPIAIECKFAEPYDKPKAATPIADKYFDQDVGRWAKVGLPRVQRFAEEIGRSASFARLNAAQLVKHLLGYATTFPNARPIDLVYFWYDTGGAEAAEHDAEVAAFASHLDPAVHFASITFQQLLPRLDRALEPRNGYAAYLTERYLNSPGS